MIVFHKKNNKLIDSAFELSTKVFFSFEKYRLKLWVESFENYGFAIQSIGNRKKKFYWSAFPTVTKLIPLHTVVVLHSAHQIKIEWLVRGGKAIKMLKNNVF